MVDGTESVNPTRIELAKHLTFQKASQKSDLLNKDFVDTLVVQMVIDLRERFGEQILVTSLYSDHDPDGNLGPHGHHPRPTYDTPGLSIDLWPENNDHEALIKAIYESPYVWTFGAGGDTVKGFVAKMPPPQDGKFVYFPDNDQDHYHLQAANANGSGVRYVQTESNNAD